MMGPEREIFYDVFENSPVGMTICDSTGQCIAANRSICEIIGATREQVLSQNYHTIASWQHSGLTRKADEAIATKRPTRMKVTLTSTFGKELTANVLFSPFTSGGKEYLLSTFDDLAEVKKVEDERERLITELRTTLEEVRNLREILPICSYCKKVRDDEGYWEQVDIYMAKHLFADISHSICPDCLKKHYPKEAERIERKQKG